MNQVEIKKAFFGFGLGVLIFYIGWRIFSEKETKGMEQPEITKENIEVAVGAYQAALQAGEPANKLSEINDGLAKEFGLRVRQRANDGRLAVCDLSGKEVQVV